MSWTCLGGVPRCQHQLVKVLRKVPCSSRVGALRAGAAGRRIHRGHRYLGSFLATTIEAHSYMRPPIDDWPMYRPLRGDIYFCQRVLVAYVHPEGDDEFELEHDVVANQHRILGASALQRPFPSPRVYALRGRLPLDAERHAGCRGHVIPKIQNYKFFYVYMFL